MSIFTNKINQIKVVLGLEVKLASDMLIDGTNVEAEEFSPGYPLFVVSEDGTKTPAPAGEHETQSGLLVEVDAEGKIISAETKTEETADAPEAEVAVAAAAEDTSIPASETPKEQADQQAAVNEVMKKMVMMLEELSAELAKVKVKMSEVETNYEKFSKSAGGVKVPTVTKSSNEDFNAVDARISALNALKKDNFFRGV